MGYYTQYNLYVTNVGFLDDEVKVAVSNAIDDLNLFDVSGSVEYGWSAYDKWYDHDDDMLALSTRFPDVVFQLYGDGEDSEDRWMTYYKNGRCQVDALHITVEEDPFDESKLLPLNNPFTVETAAEEFGVSTEYIDKIVDAFLEAGT